jgi:hypothetical protein
MIKRILKRNIEAFGTTFDYDVSFMTDILKQSTRAFFKLALLQPMTQHRVSIPLAPYYAAKIRSVLREDCGPCTQVCVNMALKECVGSDVLSAVVRGDIRQLDDDVLLAYQFTEMCLGHKPEADDLREQVVNRWGEAGLITLSYVIATSRVYPAMKYVLGHGQTCLRIDVGENKVEVHPRVFARA